MTQLLQAHSSTLYLLSLVLLSVVLLAILLKVCELWFILRKITPSLSVPFSGISVNVTGTSYLPASMVNRALILAAAITLFSVTTSVWLILDRYGRSDLVKLENVRVLKRYDATHFLMSVEDSAGQWTDFSVVPCQAFPADITAGVTLKKFYYVYDRHLNCNDWYARGAGYTAWRLPNDKPVLSDFARSESATPPCPSATDRAGETDTTARQR